MKYWWVNHKQTYKEEIEGGYIWSPKRSKNKAVNVFYENLTRTQVGDIVFSYSELNIRAIGIVSAPCIDFIRPSEFAAKGVQWDRSGWLVQIEWTLLDTPIKPKEYLAIITPLLPKTYSPIRENGNGNQGCYLASIGADLASFLLSLAESGKASVDGSLTAIQNSISEKKEEDRILSKNIPVTEKQVLILSRRGQGLYKQRLIKIEQSCRLTGVTDIRMLIASHIKPWRDCNDEEKLDGHNGLLLSPHIDKLFDGGWISFTNSGTIMLAELGLTELMKKWGINLGQNVGSFTERQETYLEYHRRFVFKHLNE
ncbi:HNH endonuclease [Spirosoma sp. KNUC1025]|uniref:HNH endonuclease n=1 Tax=Spirosoma sp. KNUC1025 TaxID=2894082 RepID=UPI00386DCACB|nr:HNH endonuclease [Spirosoma sp. KNUC1025]